MSRFIEFNIADGGFAVDNKRSGDTLGYIEWYAPWRCYVLQEVTEGTVFNGECLRDVAAFMEAETAKRKAKK